MAQHVVEYLNGLPVLDWSSSSVTEQASDILERVAREPAALGQLIRWSLQSDALRAQWESHVQFERLLLYDALRSRSFRIRLHIWHERDLDPPHQHRYPFVSKILKGGYQHTIYSASQSAIQRINADPDFQEGSAEPLCPLTKEFECRHREGDTYYMSQNLFHCARYSADSVSLFVRGETALDYSLEVEEATGRVLRRNGGAAREYAEHQLYSVMDEAQIAARLRQLQEWGLIE